MRVKVHVKKPIPTKNLIRKLTVGKTGTSNGVTYLVQQDGGILLQGTATADVIFGQNIFGSSAFPIEPGTYTLSGGVNLGIWLQGKVVENDSISIANNGVGNATYTFNQAYTFRWNLRITKGRETNLVIYPMFQHGSVKTEFEPYNENGRKNLLNLNKYRLEDYYGKKAVALNVSHLEIGKKYTFSTNCPFIRFLKIGIESGSANSVHYYGTPLKTWTFTMARSPSTPTGTLYLYIGRNWDDFNTIDDFKPYFWKIEEGSAATKYESYGDCQRVKVWNGKKSKNLFNGELKKGYYSNANFDRIQSNSAVYRSLELYISPGTYTISFSKPIVTLRQIIDGVYANNTSGNPISLFKFSTKKYGKFGLSFRSKGDATTVWDDSTLIQLEKGPTATEYEPYNQARMKVHIKE